jgi:hypothetical protein
LNLRGVDEAVFKIVNKKKKSKEIPFKKEKASLVRPLEVFDFSLREESGHRHNINFLTHVILKA